jgi:hypothetical protein
MLWLFRLLEGLDIPVIPINPDYIHSCVYNLFHG